MLQQDLAMKAEALKQVDEFWMGRLGWWSESIRGWMVNHGETKHFESFLDWWCWGNLQAKSEEIPLLEVDSQVQEICSLWSH